jgi:AcrR family transcriptional regulator
MQLSEPSKIEDLPARERILLTAYRLLYKDGIRATGVDRVIAQAKVTKVTFYRHFPSKTALIREFLEYRHERWMSWFSQALTRHGGDIDALVPAMRDWFSDTNFRGCAFINSVGELGSTLPEIREITRRHKREMQNLITRLLPNPTGKKGIKMAEIISMAVDGAIVGAQYAESVEEVLSTLWELLNELRSS